MRRGLLVLVAALFALMILVGCGESDTEDSTESDIHPAVAVVTDALEARMSRSTDPADYEPLFTDPDVAQQIADSAASEDPETQPIPDWEPPYISEETSAGVEVVVVWVREGDFEDWSPATLMQVLPVDDEWRIGDAFELSEEELLQTLQ